MLETVDKVRCPPERLDLECAGFTFLSNFDSGNLGLVELVEKSPSDASKSNLHLSLLKTLVGILFS